MINKILLDKFFKFEEFIKKIRKIKININFIEKFKKI